MSLPVDPLPSAVTTRALAMALALASTTRLAQLRDHYVASIAAGVPLALLGEGALMAHLFAGFPRAIEAFHALELAAPEPLPRPAPEPGPEPDAGQKTFEMIYGRQAGEVRKRLVAFHPELERAVIEDAYTRILARPSLPVRTRELMAVCALASIPLPRQLRSHLIGALRCGATADEARDMLQLARTIDAAAASTVTQVFDEVLSSDRR